MRNQRLSRSLYDSVEPYICPSCRRHASSTTASAPSPATSTQPPPPLSSRPDSKSSNQTNTKITQSSFASYKSTLAPTPTQLSHAERFFVHSPLNFLLSNAKFLTLPPSSVSEIAFLGRSNVGKSSLLNALVQREQARLAFVSKRPGRTRQMNAFAIGGVNIVGKKRAGRKEDDRLPQQGEYERWEARAGDPGLIVLDMPGYGHGSLEGWGQEIAKYLRARKQLRRAFVLIDAEHGIKRMDEMLLEMLREDAVPHQIVLSKVDKVLFSSSKAPTEETVARKLGRLEEYIEKVREKAMVGKHGASVAADVLTCSSGKAWPPGSSAKIGVNPVRWAAMQAAGLAQLDRVRSKGPILSGRGLDEDDGPETERVVPWSQLV